MSRRVLIWVQYLLGIGHLQRALFVGNALADAGAEVTLVTGGAPTLALAAARVAAVVQLPPIHARDATFALYDENGSAVDDRLWAERRDQLLQVFTACRPDAVLLEGFPFARRAFRAELDPLIAAVRRAEPRPRLLSSIRDILVMRDDPKRHREIVDRVDRDFDAVLVHGDPSFVRLEASFPPAAEIAARVVYTGYVVAERETIPSSGSALPSGEVVVSAGGGAAGYRLLTAALEARRAGCLGDTGWRLIAGPNLPAPDFAELSRDLPANVILERYRSDFPELLRSCRVSVSQAGYNTVLDVLRAGARAVLVPFASGQETEQTRRAETLAARDIVVMVPDDALPPDRLAERLAGAIEDAASRPPGRLALDLGGAVRSARSILAIVDGEDGRDAGLGAS